MPTYKFRVEIHPKSDEIHLEGTLLDLSENREHQIEEEDDRPLIDRIRGANIVAEMVDGILEISAEVPIALEGEEVLTLRNLIRDLLHLHLDCLGYERASAYTPIFVEMVLPSGESHPLDMSVEIYLEGDFVVSRDKLQDLARHSPHLMQALSDHRMAIIRPTDTAFHCYRAVEAIRHGIAKMRDLDPDEEDGATWDALNDALNTSEEWFKPLTSAAKSARHGDPRPTSHTERIEFISMTRLVIYRFIEFLRNGGEGLDSNDYPEPQPPDD